MSGPADDASTFELAVLGAGVSGLCLARAMLRDEAGGPSLVLFDGARDDDALRTLSFWAEGPTGLDDLVTARWQTVLVVPDAGPAVRVDLGPYEYRTLFFADLQRAVKEALRAHPRHRVLDARVEAIEPAGPERVRVRSSLGDFEARWALDSRLRPSDLDGRLGPHAVRLRQHFFGALVEARAGRFDPSCATLMDFRAPGAPGRAFFYLLPLDASRALVELVSLDPLDRGDTEPLLAAYLRDRCAVSAFEVRAREAGSSPLTDGVFALRLGPRVRALGVAAGALKPSTGYALTRILDDQRALLDGLRRDGTPFHHAPRRRLYALLDGVLLVLWERAPHRMPAIFARMFARNPARRVLRFLDERAGLAEMVALVFSLPWAPFIVALGVYLARRARGRAGGDDEGP